MIANKNFKPHEVFADAFEDTGAALPSKSKERYVACYENFIEWKKRENIEALCEDAFIAYFEELAKKQKASTLYATYSMLKSTFKTRDGIDLKDYERLSQFLKNVAKDHAVNKTKNLTAEQIQTFLDEAPDGDYLAKKVILIFGIAGGCTCQELNNISVNDIQDHGKLFQVKITNQYKKITRSFAIYGQFYRIVKQYTQVRNLDAKHDRFFQSYYKGKCSYLPMGKNHMGSVVRDIAKYLKLPDPDTYNSRCLKKTFSKLLNDVKGSQLLYDA